jgi:hypothetical protein
MQFGRPFGLAKETVLDAGAFFSPYITEHRWRNCLNGGLPPILF